jgi:hypothetical protein
MTESNRDYRGAAGAMRLFFWAWAVQLGVNALMLVVRAPLVPPAMRGVGQLLHLVGVVMEAVALARLARAPSEARARGLAWSAFGLLLLGAAIGLTMTMLRLTGQSFHVFGGARTVNAVETAAQWGAAALCLAALAQVAMAGGARVSPGLSVTALVLLGLLFAFTHSISSRGIASIGFTSYGVVYTLLSWSAKVLLMIAIAGAERQLRRVPAAVVGAAMLPGR